MFLSTSLAILFLTISRLADQAVAFSPHFKVPPARLPSNGLPVLSYSELVDDAEATDPFVEMKRLGFTQGLCETMAYSKDEFAKRYWLVDDSGSMVTQDGCRLASDGKTMVSCTRWKEVQDTVEFHAQVASLLQTPASFRFLNNQAQMVVGLKQNGEDFKHARKMLQRVQPNGGTGLARKITEVKKEIDKMLPDLNKKGQRVALIIATDGCPTDDQGRPGEAANEALGAALSSLQGLPVWIVIRLCTDDEKIVSFYNQLDSRLELSMDVLDDWKSEAAEVKSKNRWVNYGLPLHRIREMGCVSRVLDLLDERKLTKDEVRDFCGLVLGEDMMDGLPDPQVDWNNFQAAVTHQVAMEDLVLNPVQAKEGPWIDLRAY